MPKSKGRDRNRRRLESESKLEIEWQRQLDSLRQTLPHRPKGPRPEIQFPKKGSGRDPEIDKNIAAMQFNEEEFE
jgi:hypothetical protein